MASICRVLALALLAALWGAQGARADDSIRDSLQRLGRETRLEIDGQAVRDYPLIQDFYRARNYAPAWTSAQSRAQLIAAVQASPSVGLRPEDYHLSQLEASRSRDGEAPAASEDILYTDALLRLASHHLHGKLDPADYLPEIDLDSTELGGDPIAVLRQTIETGEIPALLRRLTPTAPLYQSLQQGLARYQGIEARGGWATIAPGPTLHPGERSQRIAQLRTRLLASGELRGATSDEELFDDALEAAVRHFQRRHQLAVDGVVGKKTLAALNVSASQRVDQIRVNLERARWLLHDLPATYVLVDIAGFEVRFFRDHRLILQSRAVVGRPYRRTPVFRAAISYLEFNPTWTVPPTILSNDVLPEIRKDPGYLAKRNMRVLTFQGQEVDPASVDWSRFSGKNLPYMIRQDPGPDNALGRVKFMFPNRHMVYLHDTPARNLFERTERAFSSGCIRVEKAEQLAELLLGPQGWSRDDVAAAFAEKKTRKVELATAVPVLLYYWTVAVGENGELLFKVDLYDRDRRVLEGLNRLGE